MGIRGYEDGASRLDHLLHVEVACAGREMDCRRVETTPWSSLRGVLL